MPFDAGRIANIVRAVVARSARLDCKTVRPAGGSPINKLSFPVDVILYTREGCHLCDDARTLLEQHGLQPRRVDIDADAELRERFNECVPVVEIDGKVRFRGRIEPILLRRLLS